MFKLSGDKATQESEVMARFVDGFNSLEARRIGELRPLPENDHDFLASVDGVPLHIQLTELVDRMYRTPISPEAYKAGLGIPWIHDRPGCIPDNLDEEKRDSALASVISAKLAKSYARPQKGLFWLIVFCTSHYLTAYVKNGELQASEGLSRARQALALSGVCVFDEIWFTDLQTRPIGVWPHV